jgi:hypothetical protein
MTVYRKYLVQFAGTALAGVFLAAMLNLLVDPYNRFGLNRLGIYISAEREFKSTEFPRFAPDAVLLGNSRAALIDVSGLKGHRFFNAAFGSAEIEEMRSFIEHYVHDQKLVVISLDLNSFSPQTQAVADPFQPLTFRRSLDYVLSLQSIEYSVRTITDHLKGRATDLAPNGSFRESNWAAKADVADDETARRRVNEYREKLAGYRFDPARLAALRDIHTILEQRRIPLLVYIAPINGRVWQGMEGTSGLAELDRARKAIEEIVPQTIDLSMSEYSAPEGFFRGDPVHFRSAVGQRFLNERVLKTSR